MQDVDAKYRCQGSVAGCVTGPTPVRIIEIDALRRAQICDACMRAPRGDALEVRFINVAGPPRNPWCAGGERCCVLPSAAADFQEITTLRRQESANGRPDRLMVAMKSGGNQPAVSLRRLGGF